MNAVTLDRAVGVVLGQAAGDALGSQYEFGPSHPDSFTPRFGRGTFGHGVGEWTDDTSMAVPILQAVAAGRRLDDAATLDGIVAAWHGWAQTAQDVGTQTRAVLRALDELTADAAVAASRRQHARSGHSGGNGSLMRTGPVALGYLDRSQAELVAAAGSVAQLTHWEQDNVDACALWCLALREAVLTGSFDMAAGLPFVSPDRRSRWEALIAEAVAPAAHPRDFKEHNGWVVRAFQSALCAVSSASSLVDALERAVRGGGDTDTVAAIAGSLAGALWGGSAVPLAWQRVLQGWPGFRASDLTRLAVLAARHGVQDADGWPTGDRMPVYAESDVLVAHPHDDGLLIGSIAALDRLPHVDAVVSLCRVGTHQVPADAESIPVWLVDQDGKNLSIDHVLTDAADTVAALRAEGKTVFLHCAEARSRTAAVAALYAVRHRGVPLDRAWTDVESVLPGFAPARFLRDAVNRVTP